jgi:hypothetical protein
MEEKYDGDLLDLMCANLGSFSVNHGAYLNNKELDKYNFFEKVTTCGRNCRQCSYCQDVADQLLMLGVLTPEKAEDILPAY